MRNVVTQQVSTDGEMTLIAGAPSDCDCKVITRLLQLNNDFALLLVVLPYFSQFFHEVTKEKG